MNVRALSVVGLGCWLVASSGCASLGTPRSPDGLPAFHQVDEALYRGAQPSPEAFDRLQQLGVKTVISLQQPSKAMKQERRLAEQHGMRWVSLPMWFWWRPSDRQIREFLSLTGDPAHQPVFVHCRQGRNRAGIMVALHRIVHNRWSPQEAYVEARHYGLAPWNLLSRYLLFHEAPQEFAKAVP